MGKPRRWRGLFQVEVADDLGGGFGGGLVGVVYYQISMFWLLEALVIHLLDAVGFPFRQVAGAAVGEADLKVRRKGDALKLHALAY